MSLPIVDSALKVITEGIKYLTLLQKTAPIRRMRKAIEAGEKYIQINRREGHFDKLTDKQRTRLLKHYYKVFFNNNN